MKKYNVKFKKIGISFFSIIAICTITYIAVYKLIEYNNNKKQENISQLLNTINIPQDKITNGKTERMLQVEELQKENTNLIGWIEISGTNINYPVLQGEDNDYYLTHNYKKEKVAGGSIFLDKDYDFSIPSSNLLIYGHRNNQGLMFEDLIKYKNEDFYKQHSSIRFSTKDDDSQYEIISVFNSRVYYKNEKNVFRYYYFINATTEEEYEEFVENCKKSSLYETGKTASYGEQLITLSTCDYSQENGRFVVVARQIQ